MGEVWPTKVKYLDEAGRQQYQLHIKDGKLFDNAGKLFDTSKGNTAFQGGTGKAIFVMDKNGVLQAVTRKSGHYTPTAKQLEQFLTQLKRNDVSLEKVNVGQDFDERKY